VVLTSNVSGLRGDYNDCLAYLQDRSGTDPCGLHIIGEACRDERQYKEQRLDHRCMAIRRVAMRLSAISGGDFPGAASDLDLGAELLLGVLDELRNEVVEERASECHIAFADTHDNGTENFRRLNRRLTGFLVCGRICNDQRTTCSSIP